MQNNRFDILSVLNEARTFPAPHRENSTHTSPGQILVPLTLAASESHAASLAFELASRSGLGVTLLRVVPARRERESQTHFAAFDNLFSAVWEFSAVPHRASDITSLFFCQAEVTAWLLKHVPATHWRTSPPSVACRRGDWAEEITAFSERSEVELVLLPGKLSTWGLPIVPASVRKVVRLVKKPLMVAGSETSAKSRHINDSFELVH